MVGYKVLPLGYVKVSDARKARQNPTVSSGGAEVSAFASFFFFFFSDFLKGEKGRGCISACHPGGHKLIG